MSTPKSATTPDIHTTAGKIADLDLRIDEAVHAGSANATDKQHARGKKTARERIAMGVMLVVADTKRSLEFYRDLLGLTVVDSTAGSVVLGFGTGRLLLRQVVDMSPVDRRVVHLHIEVTDVDASYQELRAKGVSFVHRPRVMSRGDKLELWAATFRDPDGHAIALTQWRDREDAPH